MPDQEPEDELETAAHITDTEAVRRVFDANNAVWTAVQSAIFTVANFALFIYSMVSAKAPRFSSLAALAILFVSAATAWLMRQIVVERLAFSRSVAAGAGSRSPAQSVSRNLSDWIAGYYLAELTVLVYAGGKQGPSIWAFIFPLILLGLRFSFARRLVFYASLYAISMVFQYLRDPRANIRVALAYALCYAIAISIGALSSRRVRRKTIEQWSERRKSAREQLRMRDELRFAREVQLSMLPEGPPKLDWADVSGVSIPATEVGGDYFDYIDVDGALAVVCGDVAGHGLASGITLSALRGGITLLRHSFTHPATVLERLHEVVSESSRRRTLVTLAAVLFDPRRKIASIANAGHPPILVRRPSGHIDTIELFGPPLGVRRSEPIPERDVAFDHGDIFLVHSDGIYEATNEAGEQYGLDRLTQLFASTDGTADAVRDAILRSVSAFRGNAPQDDDVSMVVVRIV